MEASPELTDRERQILQAVVHSYITTAQPVGSRAVVKRFGLDLSAATVRNVMADLEDTGFLQQLHTSSGRVPTEKGYRYYVDYLMKVQELTVEERRRIEREYAERLNNADEVLRHTSHLLALLTQQAGLAEAPRNEDATVAYLDLMPVSDERVALLIADHFGRVRSLAVDMDPPMAREDIEALTRFLNDHARGVTVKDLVHSIESKLQMFLDEQRMLAEQALRVLQLVPRREPSQLFLEGATQLFDQPEFNDIARVRDVLGLLEAPDRLGKMLHAMYVPAPGRTSAVLIGGDDSTDGFREISVVASPYSIEGKPVGLIGVLGPRRMHYSRLTSIVDYTAGMVGRILTRLSR